MANLLGGVGLLPASLGNVSFINSILVSTGVLLSTLSAPLQNGNSTLGTTQAPLLPAFLGGPGHNAAPWGNSTAGSQTGMPTPPETGVVRSYDLHVAGGRLAPDGYERDLTLVNGQFPGPTLEANWGDTFEITVHNDLDGPDDGTVLHWHGFKQSGTPYYDGVPGVSQCPIAPGSSMTYRFRAEQFGTTWYHSHYSTQYTDGAFGAMVVYGPQTAPYDVDLGPVFVSDFYHQNSSEVLTRALGTNTIESQTTFADSTLVQGKMNFDCASAAAGSTCTPNAGLAKFVFQPGKRHRLRFINPSSFAVVKASIDEHDMTVIANDFVPVVPYTATVLTLAAGQRTDVIVTAKPTLPSLNSAYWLRVRQPTLCALAYQPFGLAAIYYNPSQTNAVPLSLPQADFVSPVVIDCANDNLGLTQPLYEVPAAADPDVTVTIDITSRTNETGHTLYEMNGRSFRADYNDPALARVQQGNLSFAADEPSNVYDFGANATVRVVFNNHVPFAHPMHVHGQDMLVLDEGAGAWDGSNVVHPANPQRRDTQILQPSGYLVVQLNSDNPGIWPFHCHFTWHVSAGLYINVLQRAADVESIQEIADVIPQSCDAWFQFTNAGNEVDQIDSGV